MDYFLLFFGFLLMLVGVIGSLLPILPGLATSWIGLLLLHVTTIIPTNWTFLGITFAITLLLWILNYFVPAIATKKFGGSKYGIYGTTIGLFIGLIVPIPFGILFGAFLGALIGELLFDSSNRDRALKASFGAFLGFLASAFIEFVAACVFLILFLIKFWEYKSDFF